MASVTPRDLAYLITAELRADDGYDAPYVDDGDLTDVVIDGRVNLVALSEKILRWAANG